MRYSYFEQNQQSEITSDFQLSITVTIKKFLIVSFCLLIKTSYVDMDDRYLELAKKIIDKFGVDSEYLIIASCILFIIYFLVKYFLKKKVGWIFAIGFVCAAIAIGSFFGFDGDERWKEVDKSFINWKTDPSYKSAKDFVASVNRLTESDKKNPPKFINKYNENIKIINAELIKMNEIIELLSECIENHNNGINSEKCKNDIKTLYDRYKTLAIQPKSGELPLAQQKIIDRAEALINQGTGIKPPIEPEPQKSKTLPSPQKVAIITSELNRGKPLVGPDRDYWEDILDTLKNKIERQGFIISCASERDALALTIYPPSDSRVFRREDLGSEGYKFSIKFKIMLGMKRQYYFDIGKSGTSRHEKDAEKLAIANVVNEIMSHIFAIISKEKAHDS